MASTLRLYTPRFGPPGPTRRPGFEPGTSRGAPLPVVAIPDCEQLSEPTPDTASILPEFAPHPGAPPVPAPPAAPSSNSRSTPSAASPIPPPASGSASAPHSIATESRNAPLAGASQVAAHRPGLSCRARRLTRWGTGQGGSCGRAYGRGNGYCLSAGQRRYSPNISATVATACVLAGIPIRVTWGPTSGQARLRGGGSVELQALGCDASQSSACSIDSSTHVCSRRAGCDAYQASMQAGRGHWLRLSLCDCDHGQPAGHREALTTVVQHVVHAQHINTRRVCTVLGCTHSTCTHALSVSPCTAPRLPSGAAGVCSGVMMLARGCVGRR
jgi:hypothetical protein